MENNNNEQNTPLTLEQEIANLKRTIERYETKFKKAEEENDNEQKKMYANLITATRNNLHDLNQQLQRQQLQQGK